MAVIEDDINIFLNKAQNKIAQIAYDSAIKEIEGEFCFDDITSILKLRSAVSILQCDTGDLTDDEIYEIISNYTEAYDLTTLPIVSFDPACLVNPIFIGEGGAIGPAGPQGEQGEMGPIGPVGPAGSPGVDGSDGVDGTNGWTAITALVTDGIRIVTKITGWTGGTGSSPAANLYVGSSGFVTDIALAVDVRGPQGLQGIQGIQGIAGINGEDAFVYIAYADDDTGTGFTTTFSPTKFYIAILATTTEILIPVVGNFSGLWFKWKGEVGPAFQLDARGDFADRATYDLECPPFAFLAEDTGNVYFKESCIAADWSGPVSFVGDKGWSPVFAIVEDLERRVHQLVDWVGGEGSPPATGDYVGATGLVPDIADAVDIRGPQGRAFFPDVEDIFLNRDDYDNEPKDFIFHATDLGLVYIKLSDTTADWSFGAQWRGPQGIQGVNVYTEVTADYTQPAVFGFVAVSVLDTSWMGLGQILFIETGGYYAVAGIIDPITVSLENLGYATNVGPAAIVPDGSKVSPGGLKGDNTGSPTWGTIVGAITSQTDLINYLATNYLKLNGGNSPTSSINWGGFGITNLTQISGTANLNLVSTNVGAFTATNQLTLASEFVQIGDPGTGTVNINLDTAAGSYYVESFDILEFAYNSWEANAALGDIGLRLSTTGAIFTDNLNTGGLRYFADYSADYTLRSLVDKEYVDTLVASAYTEGNGIDITAGVVSLDIEAYDTTTDIQIQAISPGSSFSIYGSTVQLNSDFGQLNIAVTGTTLTNDLNVNLTGGTGGILRDTGGISGGFRYFADYSGSYTNRSLVDKEYIDTRFLDAVSPSRLLNINGVALDLSANREWRTALGDTGCLTFAPPGLSVASGTTIDIGAVTGYVVNNETTPGLPTYTYVNYAGETGKTVTTIGTGIGSYVLLNALGTISFQNTFPTSTQRKEAIYLGKVGHPTGTITTAGPEPDYITSPLAQFRDFFQAINYVNIGVRPSANGANLNINTSAGYVVGNGINFVADKTSANKLPVTGTSATTFFRRTQTGLGGAATTTIDAANYDVGGTITAIPGGPNSSVIEYVWLVPGLGFIVTYGQTVYSSLTLAIQAVGKEAGYVIYPNLIGNAIAIGAIARIKNATALNDPAQAGFVPADIFGQLVGSAGATSVSTMQNTYNNSGAATPKILTSTTNGQISFQCGSALDTDTVFGIRNIAGTTTASILGNGGASFANITNTNMTSGSVLFAGTSGLMSQDNTNFTWNNTSKILQVGGTTSRVNINDLYILDLDNVTYKKALACDTTTDRLDIGTGFPTRIRLVSPTDVIGALQVQGNILFLSGNIINASTGSSIVMRTDPAAGIGVALNTNADMPHTTGIKDIVSIGVSRTFNPTTGTGVLNYMNFAGTLNQTGAASGTVRGIYYNPIVTSVLGVHNAIESTSGNWVIGGSTNAPILRMHNNGSTALTALSSTTTGVLAVGSGFTSVLVKPLLLSAGTTSAGTGPLKFTSGSLMTTPEVGSMEYNGTNFYLTTGSAVRRSVPGIIYTQTAYKTVVNTVTETSLLNSTYTLPANFFAPGKMIRIQLFGIHSAAGAPNIQIKIKLGSTVVMDTTPVNSGSSTNDTAVINGAITCYTTGASGTVSAQGFYQETGGGGNSFPMSTTAPTVIDTTVSQVLDVTVTWGTASVNNTITMSDGFILIYN